MLPQLVNNSNAATLGTASRSGEHLLSLLAYRATRPREAQITRLKAQNAKLKERLAQSDGTIDELTGFRTQALARLAAQHEEIIRLREAAVGTTRVSRLPPPRTTVIGTCS
ncbi:hypothetical protein [Streptomyces laculatispora]|uniref:hypothetical protein n=1 Tax=Streptomyces laculatispora TaxID=887464 RepID=UPI0027DC82BB|nr:hypothetical protein [Streptomyces laculatispora]